MIKWYVGFVTAVIILCGWFFGWAQLPDKVKTVEQKQQTLEESVTNVNQALEKYIAVQQAKEEKDAEQKELLLKLIEQISKNAPP